MHGKRSQLAIRQGAAQGNMNLGNDKDFLLRVILQILPYIGYPRSLNAITCVNKAAEA